MEAFNRFCNMLFTFRIMECVGASLGEAWFCSAAFRIGIPAEKQGCGLLAGRLVSGRSGAEQRVGLLVQRPTNQSENEKTSGTDQSVIGSGSMKSSKGDSGYWA